MTRLVCALMGLLVPGIVGAEPAGALRVTRLRWDGRDRPLGFMQFEPRLSWAVTSSARGQKQTAYQVLVASSANKLVPGKADVWDSGKVASDASLNVRYGGPNSQARQRAYWTVRAWDRNDRPSAFAPASWWEMGLYDEEWEGKWIGRPRDQDRAAAAHDRSVTHLRKAFALPQAAQRARLYASAFGAYQISINGKAASDDVLAPGYTDYEKRVLFQTYDVTPLVRRGDNVIGAMVAGGWCTAGLGGRSGACGYEPPRVMLQLEITLADGSTRTVISDESWRAHAGPIVSAHLYDGESYDARREIPGWDTARFDAEGWEPVHAYDREKERDLVADQGPRVRVTDELRPVRVSEPRVGVYRFDLGQNVVGWARLRIKAAAGTTVTLRYAEALALDGTLALANPGAAAARDQYVARGAGFETWEPQFTVHAFRYVEVTGLSQKPGADAISARVVHSVMPVAGQLETSNPSLNRLIANIDWSQRAGFLSVPTRGSARDERLGGMLEARAFALTSCLYRDVQAFYRKWIDDIRDAQLPSAAYSDVSPRVSDHDGGPAGAAGVMVPFALYRCYADRTALDAHMTSMGRWLDLVRSRNPDLVWAAELGAFDGDPLESGPRTDKALIATTEFVAAADALAQIARFGGADLASYAAKYQTLAESTRAAFARRFVVRDGRLAGDTQGAYAQAIALGVLSDETRGKAAPHLIAAVERQGHHLTTGVLGSAHLLPALSRIGRDDLAYRVLTTVPERWDAGASGAMSHHALGAMGEWMYDAIGGIALDPQAPAGKHVFVRPRPGGGLAWARASYQSPHGLIKTEWRKDGKLFQLKVNVPANTSATVTLPYRGKSTESGRPLAEALGVIVRGASAAGTTVAVESGSYDFSVTLP